MNYFSIRDVENLTGIKAHTWRIWEKRHGLCLPQRKETNHRYYDAAILKQILQIAYLYNHGYKISKIANLSPGEVSGIAASVPEGYTENYFITQLLQAALDYNEQEFEKICNKIFDTNDIEHAVFNIIYPYLERVGTFWLTDHLVPGQEHFTSNIIRQKLITAIDQLPPVPATTPVTILFTPEKELHEIPLLFIYYLMKQQGKATAYLGCSIKLQELVNFVMATEVSVLHFHLITNLTNKNPTQYLHHLADAFPRKSIVMSGRQAGQVEEAPPHVRLLLSMNELVEYTKA